MGDPAGPGAGGGSFAGLNGISCTAADFCEAVGSYQKGGTFRSLAEVWNGSHWLLQAPSTVAGATSSQLNAVSCVSATYFEAAGDAKTTATRQVGVLEKWNGTTWSVQEKVLPAGTRRRACPGSRARRARSARRPGTTGRWSPAITCLPCVTPTDTGRDSYGPAGLWSPPGRRSRH